MPAGTVSPIDTCLDQLTQWSGVVADDTLMPDLLTALEKVPDPRARRGRRYRLPSLIAVGLCAVSTGARSFYAIADWAAGAPREVLERCGIRFRVPSEATIRQVFGRVDGGRTGSGTRPASGRRYRCRGRAQGRRGGRQDRPRCPHRT